MKTYFFARRNIVILSLLAFLAGAHQVTAQSFVLSSSPEVGTAPFGIAAADVNNDGKPDLISANAGDNTLTVLTNDGSGVFSSNATYIVGNTPISVAAADVNND